MVEGVEVDVAEGVEHEVIKDVEYDAEKVEGVEMKLGMNG